MMTNLYPIGIIYFNIICLYNEKTRSKTTNSLTLLVRTKTASSMVLLTRAILLEMELT